VLKEIGFDVIKKTDATKSEMEQTILDFSRELGKYNVALFFYAGHGIQVDGSNFLIPIDAKLNDRVAAPFEAVDVSKVVSQFERYPNNVNIVILDACRNNPFKTWLRGGDGGFKAIPAPSGTIIAFATSEGATASDGSNENGLYTSQLVKQIKIPQRIEDVFIQTRVDVRLASNNQQSPQEWSQLTGKFFFTGTEGSLSSTAATIPIEEPVKEKVEIGRGIGGKSEFETKKIISNLLGTGYTVVEVLNSNVPIRYLYGLNYQGGLIADIDEKNNTGTVVTTFDLARGSKVNWAEAKALCEAFTADGFTHERYDRTSLRQRWKSQVRRFFAWRLLEFIRKRVQQRVGQKLQWRWQLRF
jgi:Caspase domain